MTDQTRNYELPSLRAFAAQLEGLAETETRSHRSPHRAGIRYAVAAAAVVAVVAATPPGRALAERIGELIGIGDVPREEGNYGPNPRIIGVGETRLGHPWEAVISGEAGGDETCVFLGFVEVKGTGMGACNSDDLPQFSLAKHPITAHTYRAPAGILPEGSVPVQGLTTPQVARVVVTYVDGSGSRGSLPAELFGVSPDLIAELDLIDDPFGFYVAFLPPGAIGRPPSQQTVADLDDIEIHAYDSAGEEVAVQRLDHPVEVWLDHAPVGHLPRAGGR